MKLHFRILIIDDHPMIANGYDFAIKDYDSKYTFETECAYTTDEVLDKMKKYKDYFFDIVLLDINLPPSKNRTVINGEDLGIRIKQSFPKSKIIVHTALNDGQRIANIYRTINPEGFLIKTEVDADVLMKAIRKVIEDGLYYSQNVNYLLKFESANIDKIEALDLKILYYLSLGEKMKNLPNHIPLSIATIERRKKNLKIFFGIADGSTKQLLDIARSKGFI